MSNGKKVFKCEVPVVLFFFLRCETVLKIVDVVRTVHPSKMYLFSDGPRNEKEKVLVEDARKRIVSAIDWDCEIIKQFSDVNKGVFQQIGLGAVSVFQREKTAIFLEDDNLPDSTFFEYASTLLEKYQDNGEILWICGTNYLEKYETEHGESYVFTKHLLPCGWASWANKFTKFYDVNFSLFDHKEGRRNFRKSYQSKGLYRQQRRNIVNEVYRRDHQKRYASWDFHMNFSLRANNLYGISPKYNQINNIGVDVFSVHGGTSWKHPNTSKFCGIPTHHLDFPLVHPSEIKIDPNYEKKVAKIILAPFWIRFLSPVTTLVKKAFGIYPDGNIKQIFSKKAR